MYDSRDAIVYIYNYTYIHIYIYIHAWTTYIYIHIMSHIPHTFPVHAIPKDGKQNSRGFTPCTAWAASRPGCGHYNPPRRGNDAVEGTFNGF